MGLINFAKGEGSQAIQLFGRGVRLHGYNNRLKRSGKADALPLAIPQDIAYLETLTIFGVKADYMAKFKEYLEIEGLPPNAQPHNYKMATVKRFDITRNKLKVLKVKDGINFRKQARRFLLDVPVDQNCKDYFIHNKIRIDCRAKVQGIMSPNDDNFVEEYTFTYTPEHDTDTNYLQLEKYVNDLSALLSKDKAILKGEMGLFTDGLISFDFEKHLFTPLVYKSDKLTTVQVTPVSLNCDELSFVYRLGKYLNENKKLFINIDIFLLRNKSKSGIGFFEAGNFYPDYILWIDTKDKQYMTFIDPKGLIHYNPGDPKIKFYQTIKELEKRPLLQETKGSKDIILNSFIVSGSGFASIKNKWSLIDSVFSDKTGFSKNHVVFLEHDDCIKTMFEKLLGI